MFEGEFLFLKQIDDVVDDHSKEDNYSNRLKKEKELLTLDMIMSQ